MPAPTDLGSPISLALAFLSKRRVGAAPAPEDFQVALGKWFMSDPDLLAVFPGGLVASRAAPGQQYPYARMTEVRAQEPLSGDDWVVSMALSAYASSAGQPDDDVAYLSRFLVAKLEDVQGRARLAYQGWVEAGHRSVVPREPVPVGAAPGRGDPIWRADIDIEFFVVASAVIG